MVVRARWCLLREYSLRALFVDKIVFGNYFYLPPIEVSPGRQLHHCFLQGLMTKPEPLVKMEVVKLNLMFFMK